MAKLWYREICFWQNVLVFVLIEIVNCVIIEFSWRFLIVGKTGAQAMVVGSVTRC